MFKLMGKEIITILGEQTILIWTYVMGYICVCFQVLNLTGELQSFKMECQDVDTKYKDIVSFARTLTLFYLTF